MKLDNWLKFSGKFVLDSTAYTWTAENVFTIRTFRLEKMLAGRLCLVARYRQQIGQLRQGGTLAVDAREVDLYVAVLTCVAVMRKLRPRAG
ncbi:hypothetical protein EJ06DRAFT_529276 [Trichodelitschia bisporula]|uniref:Uncharacterized protein n=1 Tax=Trichodelitschia bisporula TaxID=703511 RepID=A0A6G1HZ22_9PEZI|nr:hypothetical protein EJ06DRAFT_529276 [Trichodelitschia bisporula]